MSTTLEKPAGRADPPDMEARVALLEVGQRETMASLVRLESLVRQGLDKTERLTVEIAELKGRVSQLPTTITLLGFVLAVLTMAGALKVFVK